MSQISNKKRREAVEALDRIYALANTLDFNLRSISGVGSVRAKVEVISKVALEAIDALAKK